MQFVEQQTNPLSAEDIARIDREFLRGQERDRMSERSQLWTIFISLASGFGFIAVQGGDTAYLALLFPILLAFLTMHVRNSEDTLKQIRKYLYKQEQKACYQGYEHFVREPSNTRTSHGGYKVALRGAFCTTGTLVLGGVVRHMATDRLALPIILVAAIAEIATIAFTWYQLSSRKKRQHKPTQTEEVTSND
jgi:hypothetical protein